MKVLSFLLSIGKKIIALNLVRENFSFSFAVYFTLAFHTFSSLCSFSRGIGATEFRKLFLWHPVTPTKPTQNKQKSLQNSSKTLSFTVKQFHRIRRTLLLKMLFYFKISNKNGEIRGRLKFFFCQFSKKFWQKISIDCQKLNLKPAMLAPTKKKGNFFNNKRTDKPCCCFFFLGGKKKVFLA